MRKVGQLVLDTPVGNVFNEVEQIAFSPAAFVPGKSPVSDEQLAVKGQRKLLDGWHLLAGLRCVSDYPPCSAQRAAASIGMQPCQSCKPFELRSHHPYAVACDADGKSPCRHLGQ